MKGLLTVIFDLDGTLIDSFNQISKCASWVRDQLGMKRKSKQDLEKLIGLPADALFSDSPPEILEEAVLMFRNELLREIKRENAEYEGAADLLNMLKIRDIRIAIATSKPHHLAQLVVENSALNGLIDHVQGLDGFAPKPDPEVIKRCQIRLQAKRFAMIGDRPEDINAGLNAGCYTAGIAQGAFGEKSLRDVGAHETFRSIKHLSLDIDQFLNRLQAHEQ